MFDTQDLKQDVGYRHWLTAMTCSRGKQPSKQPRLPIKGVEALVKAGHNRFPKFPKQFSIRSASSALLTGKDPPTGFSIGNPTIEVSPLGANRLTLDA